MGSDTPRVELSTSTVVSGIWRDLVVTEWRQQGSAAEVAATYDLQRAHIRRLSAKISTLAVVPGAVIKPIDPAMRLAIDEAARTIHPHTRASVLVLPASGFGGAIVRSVLTSLNFIRRLDFPNKITSTVPLACMFVAPHIDGAPTPADVEAVYREIAAAAVRPAT